MQVQAGVAALLEDLLDLCFPPRCAACREPLASSRGGPFCGVCADALEPVPPGCPRCGLPGQSADCRACREAPPAFVACDAGGLFGGPLADAIHALKYERRAAIARPLGAWLATRLAAPLCTRVVAVPLARRRRVERGYDQAALLACAFARAARLPRAPDLLRRVRDTPAQVGRSREERLRNVDGAFVATRAVGGDLLLVDDVVTTGATASACAAALLSAGARSVRVAALARAE